jgi:anti-anti-sigma factor
VELSVQKHGDVPVFRLKGRLSVVGADEFEQQVVQAITAGAKRLVFVADDLEYVSSAGLRVFYVAIKRLGDDGSRVSFCGLRPAVRSVFDIVGLSEVVRLFPTEAEALADLTATPRG